MLVKFNGGNFPGAILQTPNVYGVSKQKLEPLFTFRTELLILLTTDIDERQEFKK